MVAKSNKRRIITISKELDKLINLRGGNKYIINCLKRIILDIDTPNYNEIKESTGQDIYEQTAIHKKGENWYEKLFPKGE